MILSMHSWLRATTFRAIALVLVTAGIGIALPSGVTTASAAAGPAYDIRESYTVSGDLIAGNIVNLNFTLTNVGTDDFVPTHLALGETRPRAAFGELVLPPGLKRQQPPVNAATDNPLIVCEAYRGTHGGLTQAFYNDICRMWFYGSIPAGGSVSAVLPVKLVGGAGDFTTWGGAETYPTDQWGSGPLVLLNGGQWMSLTFHVNPVPPKIVTGGGTGAGLPDLQVTTKASTGSPAAGSFFYMLYTVKNSGKVDATDATFTAILPDGLTSAGASWEFGGCTIDGSTVSCTPGRPISSSLAQTVQLSFFAPLTPGTFSVTGVVADSNGDSNLANNSGTVSVTIK